MMMNDVIKIVKPEPDSQYRLRDCACGSDNVAFVNYKVGCEELWRVQCFDCLRCEAPATGVRHQVQVAWNNRMRRAAGKGR